MRTLDILRERWSLLRDRWLGSPAFREAAAAHPLTRWMARRRAAQVFDLMAGFVYSQVLLACVRLHLLERLHTQGPQTVDTLAQALKLPPAGCERLLRAAVALRLLEWRPGARLGLGVLGLPLATEPGLRALVLHHQTLYTDLADPLPLLQGRATPGALAHFWPYALNPEAPPPAGAAESYSALMSATQALVGRQLLRAYPLGRHHRLLDIGGGEASFAIAAARHAPALQVEVFDLPPVAERARQRLEAAGLAARSRSWPGDFLREPLPPGADLISLLRVVHDHEDATVLQLLHKARAALAPGGRLLLAEPMAGTAGAEAMGDAYFGFYLLAMGQGQARDESRLRALLQEAGFRRVRRLATDMPLLLQALVAEAGD